MKRPVSLTVFSVLFGIGGVAGLAQLAALGHPLRGDDYFVGVVRLLAIVAAVFLLRGYSWARWLAMAWISFHVAISAFHSILLLVLHLLVFAVFAYILFRRPSSEYFRAGGSRA